MNRNFKTIDPKTDSREISFYSDQGEGGQVRFLDVPYQTRKIKNYRFYFNSAAAKTPRGYSVREIVIERNQDGTTDHTEKNYHTEWEPATARKLYKELTKELLKPVKTIWRDGRHLSVIPDPAGEIINNDYYFYTIAEA